MNHDAILIRAARPEDAEKLLNIYAPYVETTSITFEYTVPSVEEFRSRIKSTLNRYPYLTAVRGNEIVGYAYASEFRTRAAYSWDVETSIYIKMDQKGNGIGKKLYDCLEKILAAQHIQNLYACITYPNPQSIGFHEHLGYRTIGHFTKCGYKFQHWDDMIWMEKMLGDHPKTPEKVLSFPEVASQFPYLAMD